MVLCLVVKLDGAMTKRKAQQTAQSALMVYVRAKRALMRVQTLTASIASIVSIVSIVSICIVSIVSICMVSMEFFLSERICEMTRMVQFCVYVFSGITSHLGSKKYGQEFVGITARMLLRSLSARNFYSDASRSLLHEYL